MTYKEYRILSHSWRILSAILIAFILISCTTPRSPRGSYGETSIRTKKNTDADQKTNKTSDQKQNSKDGDANGANSEQNKLPTLNEQVKNLENKQSITNERVNILQTEMNDIKSSLAEVRGKLKMSLNPSNPSALAGEKLNTKSNAHAFDAEDQSDDGIILPDNFSNENTPAKPIKKQEPKKVIKPVVKHVVKPKIKSDDDATEPIVKKQASAAAAVFFPPLGAALP